MKEGVKKVGLISNEADFMIHGLFSYEAFGQTFWITTTHVGMIIITALFIVLGLVAVSYTHLDVYKRQVKDEEEIGHIRDAIRCAEGGFEKLIPKLKIGMTEKDLADELHYLVSKEGAEAMSFGTIVASGPRGAMAHGVPTDKVIENGDMVVVDFGVMKDGYCSDMTRTLLFGDISKELSLIHI